VPLNLFNFCTINLRNVFLSHNEVTDIVLGTSFELYVEMSTLSIMAIIYVHVTIYIYEHIHRIHMVILYLLCECDAKKLYLPALEAFEVTFILVECS